MVSGEFAREVDSFRNQGAFSYYADIYFRNRIIELLRTINKKVIFINHWEAWWAPLLIKFFPASKVLYLKRNPEDVVYSHLATSNEDGTKLKDISNRKSRICTKIDFDLSIVNLYKDNLNNSLIFHEPEMSNIDRVITKVSLVDKFAMAVEQTVSSERFIEISADLLFSQDLDEVGRLLNFFDLFTEDNTKIACDHFLVKYNTKNRQNRHTEEEVSELRKIIKQKI